MTHEVNFLITDPSIFWALQTTNDVGPYAISPRKILEIEDAYLDTKKRRLFAAGYSCRRRSQDNGVLITLSQLPFGQREPKHWETTLEKVSPHPVDWPKSQLQKRIIKVVAHKKLRTIINLYQTRIIRNIYENKENIGRFNLDEITLLADGAERHFKHLRINLRQQYVEAHLENITTEILAKWPLKVETLTKFERALALENNKPA